MVRVITFLLIIFLSTFSIAEISFQVVGPCEQKPYLNTTLTNINYKNIGDLTISTLTKNNIDYIGDETKVDSINNTPVGQAALELVSRSEMRAYGWCFYVNGVQPDVYPDKVKLIKSITSVTWVFSYAHYFEGQWLSMCEPSWKVKPSFICKK